jgi:hypothetical protein
MEPASSSTNNDMTLFDLNEKPVIGSKLLRETEHAYFLKRHKREK